MATQIDDVTGLADCPKGNAGFDLAQAVSHFHRDRQSGIDQPTLGLSSAVAGVSQHQDERASSKQWPYCRLQIFRQAHADNERLLGYDMLISLTRLVAADCF